jgi:hypothetical protein
LLRGRNPRELAAQLHCRLLFLRSRKKISAKTVRKIAIATRANEFCPAPRTIGIGPMSMTAPPLTPFRFESDPSIINAIPMKMMANAAKNSHIARGKGVTTEGSAAAVVDLSLA